MTYNDQNVFARILRDELPCERIYEDKHTVAFMDLMPQAEGHALVVPRESAVTLLDLSADAAIACIRTVKLLAPVVMQAVDAPGLMVMQINGAEAGQTVPHVHFHIIPRRAAEPLKMHAAVQVDRGRLQVLAARIRAILAAQST